MKIGEILALVAQFPAGATPRELANRAYSNPDGFKIRSFAGILGRLVARGALQKRGKLYFANPASEPPQWPAAWYATPYGPRWWNGAKWC